MRKTILTLALAATTMTAAAGHAQDAPPPPRGATMYADANHDGVLTRAEAVAQADARFVQMDADHDGILTPSERRDYREALRDRRIADGKTPPPPPSPRDDKGKPHGDDRGPGGPGRTMTRQEATDRAAARFDRADTNHDGRLDQAEMAAMRPMRGPRGAGGGMAPPSDAPRPDAD